MTASDVKPPQDKERQGTPPPPPYSPVTPGRPQSSSTTPAAPESTIAASPLPPAAYPALSSVFESIPAVVDRARSAPNKNGAVPALPPPQFIREPAPVPISESENPDAIALRSAITILQIQKQQALRDIQTLDKLKQAAAEDPHAFASEFLAGSLQSDEGDLFHLSPRKENNQEDTGTESGPEAMDVDQVKPTNDNNSPGRNQSRKLSKIPKPQNIVRMPAINWAKYHIVGEPLDKMHEEQRLRPTPGEPRHDTPSAASTSRSPEHTLAAPYRPFVDKIEPHVKSRNVGR